jgi:hypothetical protein
VAISSCSWDWLNLSLGLASQRSHFFGWAGTALIAVAVAALFWSSIG